MGLQVPSEPPEIAETRSRWRQMGTGVVKVRPGPATMP